MSALPRRYRVDLADPRAPSQELWDAMSPDERARVVEALPGIVPDEWCIPEGDRHSGAKREAQEALRAYFRAAGRAVYISGELNVYYPGEPLVAPDVFAVLDVEDRPRDRWVVSDEGRGLDWILEVHVLGDPRRDLEHKRALYARFGVPEYFVFDRERLRLHGFRAARSEGAGYEAIPPHLGRLRSEVLGLDLVLEGERLRFYAGTAALPDAEERIRKVEAFVARAEARADRAEAQAEQAHAQAEQAHAQAEQAHAQAEQAHERAEAAESALLAERARRQALEAELARLRGA